jgi:hypothetical protein
VLIQTLMHALFRSKRNTQLPFSTKESLTSSKKLSACGVFMMARLRSRLAHIKGAGPLRRLVYEILYALIKGKRGGLCPRKFCVHSV